MQNSSVQQSSVTPSLTKQRELWAAECAAHLSAKLSGQAGLPKEPPHRFVLIDPLLRSLLLTNQPREEGIPQICSWTKRKALGAALLTWFVQRALGLYRLPFCEDRTLTKIGLRFDEHALRSVLRELTPQRVDSITDEVERLYKHTQTQLQAKELSVVHLRRHIDEYEQDEVAEYGHIAIQKRGQAGQFLMLKIAAQELGHTTVNIDMDTLNSWGDDDGYAYRAIHLNCSFPIADVLCATELVAADKNMEPGEWLVINRSPTGLVTLPISNLNVRMQALDQDHINGLFERHDPKDVLNDYQPLVLRPSLNIYNSDISKPRPPLPKNLSYRLAQVWRLVRSEHI